MDLYAFVEEHLPAPPASVLEVGCGRGELSMCISHAGYDVVAIDPHAPPGELFQSVSLEKFSAPGPFDAVVASRALHHIADLPGALDKIARLLRREGRLIVSEHAWDRLDRATAQSYLECRTKLDAAAPRSLDGCLAEWQHDHAGLHGYPAMREELDRRFAQLFFAWTPYLYRELSDTVAESEERRLIENGEIKATGFRYVGEPAQARDAHRVRT